MPGRPLRVERLLANLGYGKRRECQQLVKKGRVTTREGKTLKVGMHGHGLLCANCYQVQYDVGVASS